MNCKTGDKVRFLNETGGGTITRIISATMVYVEDKDGFEIPVRVADLIVVNQADSQSSTTNRYESQPERAKAAAEPVVKVEIDENTEENEDREGEDFELLLAFVPLDGNKAVECDMDVFFINDSGYRCMYIVSEWTKSNCLNLLGRGDLSSDTKELVCLLRRDEMKESKTLNVTFMLYKHREYLIQPPQQVNVELNPLKFIRASSFVENDFFDEKACVLKIANSSSPSEDITVNAKALQDAMRQKKDKPAVATNVRSSELEEIDLHIEALTDKPEELDAAQMLEIQKNRFTIALDLGISAGTRRMVFIHGVGNGKLKHEIRRLLDTQYAGKVRYQDASFKEYGYGATMVML
ncbi:MAG: DUF2027 domain-containing protein [Prevotellaceae bacterium]|nr:DUF2027 domain-containing protein [Prevotellaceae bacterium]